MGLSADWKRLFLRGLKWDAEDAGSSLLDVLKTAARSRLESTSQGRVLTSTSGNGRTHTFTLPANGQGASQTDVVEVVEAMFRLYAEAKANLGGAPSDDETFAEMLLLLEPVNDIRNDFVALRG